MSYDKPGLAHVVHCMPSFKTCTLSCISSWDISSPLDTATNPVAKCGSSCWKATCTCCKTSGVTSTVVSCVGSDRQRIIFQKQYNCYQGGEEGVSIKNHRQFSRKFTNHKNMINE